MGVKRTFDENFWAGGLGQRRPGFRVAASRHPGAQGSEQVVYLLLMWDKPGGERRPEKAGFSSISVDGLLTR